jgi:hypothetical protein
VSRIPLWLSLAFRFLYACLVFRCVGPLKWGSQANANMCRYLREAESKFLPQTRYLENAAFEMIKLCLAISLVSRAALC